MTSLRESILCRDEQIDLLSNLLGSSSIIPGSIFLYGYGGTGKTLVTSLVCERLKIRLSTISCLEMYCPRFFYENLLNQMAGYILDHQNNYTPVASVNNTLDFVHNIKTLAERSTEKHVFLLEQSERLRDGPSHIFRTLCRLQELCDVTNICVIFSSRIPIDKFRDPAGFLEPIVLHFRQYTKDELVQILVSEISSVEISKAAYENYISMILNVFYMATRNLPELKHLAELNLDMYVKPIKQGDIKEEDIRGLWKNIEPHLKKALSTVYLREISSDQFLEMKEKDESELPSLNINASHISRLELPFYSKFLLGAAYLASYNPSSTDKRFFMKNHGKNKKTQSSIKAKLRASNQLCGPKAFPLDRMLAIFYAIIEEKVAPTAKIFSQVTSLVSLGLLVSVGNEENIDCTKYKCTVSLDNIRYICRTVNFDIVKYLYEFSG